MVVPALLTNDRAELIKMLDVCAGFTDLVQIDIMDGEFVPSKSVSCQDLDGIKPPIETEAHLMVKNPIDWIGAFKKMGSKRIIFHYEIDADHVMIINEIKNNGLEAGIALNPQTKTNSITPLIDKIDSLLFMSVNPGFYGAPFIPEVLGKIAEFKKNYPHKLVGIDGGVKLDNLKEIVSCGVDYVCVGSAIIKAQSPKEAFLKLTETYG